MSLKIEIDSVKAPRLASVDALRGFAMLSIILLHNLEHFDFYYFPEYLPEWMKTLDLGIWNTLFFLFGGKSYAIFSLLFGFTFFLQNDHQEKKGLDFRARFLWRLSILFVLGYINSIFFDGDIMSFYAIIGISLVIVCKWNNKAVFITAIVLMLQPLVLANIFYALANKDFIGTGNLSDAFFVKAASYMSGPSFWDLAKGNLTNGKMAVIYWLWENGRFFQAASLFMFGMLIGRTGLFLPSEGHLLFWKRVLWGSAISFLIVFGFSKTLPNLFARKVLANDIQLLFTSWSNMAFTVLLVSSFLLLYSIPYFEKILGKLEAMGKMSLTNYMLQSIFGSFIYYGFGLGLYQYTGATFSLVIGIGMVSLQLFLSTWWLQHHSQGPIERCWQKATWFSLNSKN